MSVRHRIKSVMFQRLISPPAGTIVASPDDGERFFKVEFIPF
jgi:hypothetical protein